MDAESRSWLVRGSKNGLRDQWMLANNLTGIDFSEIPEVATVRSLDDMRRLVAEHMPRLAPGAVTNYASQMLAFSTRIQISDIVALPIKNSGTVALGVVVGPYEYHDGLDRLNHVRQTRWVRTVTRSVIGRDLQYSLNAPSTITQVARNNASKRLRAIMEGADVDPWDGA